MEKPKNNLPEAAPVINEEEIEAVDSQSENNRLAAMAVGGLIGDARFQRVNDGASLQQAVGKDLGRVKELLGGTSVEEQERLAQVVFVATIGAKGLDAVKYMTPVYIALQDTAFGRKFKELEDNRLRDAGFKS